MSPRTGDPAALARALRDARRVLITTHASPDGDAIGSELAVAELVETSGGAVRIINRDPSPATLGFLPGLDRIEVAPELPAELGAEFDLGVVLDCPGIDRPGFSGLDRLPLVTIDHHLQSELFGAIALIDERAAATGELVLEVLEAGGIPVTATMATCLYTAIVTDTGDFRYSNTTPTVLRAAARLVEAGAKPHEISSALSEHVPERVVRLTALVLETLALSGDGRIATLSCDRAMLDAVAAVPSDTEDLINTARAIDGVEVAAFFKAFTEDGVRVSLRSRGAVDVQAVASRFGGGGHRQAAGCTVRMPLAEAHESVVAALLGALEQSR